MSDVVILREINKEMDLPLVMATWRNAEWFSTDQKMNSNEFFRKATKRIKEILKEAKVKIACKQDDHDFIFGYSAMTGKRLEFVYVKPDYRKKGIGKILTKGYETWAEPKTKIGRAIERNLTPESRAEAT